MSTRFLKVSPNDEVGAEALVDLIEAALPPSLVPWPVRVEEGPGAGKLRQDTNGNWVIAWPFDGPFIFAGNTLPCPETLDPEALVIVDSTDYPEEPEV